MDASLEELLSLYHAMNDQEKEELLDLARELAGDEVTGDNFQIDD